MSCIATRNDRDPSIATFQVIVDGVSSFPMIRSGDLSAMEAASGQDDAAKDYRSLILSYPFSTVGPSWTEMSRCLPDLSERLEEFATAACPDTDRFWPPSASSSMLGVLDFNMEDEEPTLDDFVGSRISRSDECPSLTGLDSGSSSTVGVSEVLATPPDSPPIRSELPKRMFEESVGSMGSLKETSPPGGFMKRTLKLFKPRKGKNGTIEQLGEEMKGFEVDGMIHGDSV